MSSYVVRERERERDWDTTSVRSGRESGHYTTVRRYKVPDRDDRRDDRTVIDFKERRDDRRDDRTVIDDDEIKITRRESRRDHDDYDHDHDHDRDFVSYRIVKRDTSPSPERTERRIRIVREESRSPSPVRSVRYEREREHEHDRGWDRNSLSTRPYELEKYSKSTEYFSRPEPQPIIIRNEIPQPVIIRDEPRREREVIIEKEIERTKSVRSASSSPSRAPSPRVDMVAARSEHLEEVRSRHSETAMIPAPLPPPQEDYYYERVTREVDRPHHDREYEEPRRRHRHHRDRDHYSDDEVMYEKRVVEREESPHTKRHLAEGAVAGLAASALVNHHRKKQGEPVQHRGRKAIGYAAIGAVGAEALSRANHAWRDRSRNRSEDDYYDDRRRGRGGDWSRSRSRSRSKSHGRRNTALAIAGLAAVAAGAYAVGKRGKNDNNTTIIEDRRSRSRHRRHSISGASDRSLSRSLSRGSADKATNPKHRNQRMAQAGLAGAALAGLAEHRSKSRGKSKTRVQQGVPIVAAGLGSAAAAGLYETFKARKERKKSQERAASRSRSRAREYSLSRSRSRSRSRSVGHSSRRAAADGAMVHYGSDPLYNSDDRHHRSRSRGRSVSSSPRRRSHSRSRSRGQNLATGAAAAGVAGLALNEARKRRERKKEEKERKREYSRNVTFLESLD